MLKFLASTHHSQYLRRTLLKTILENITDLEGCVVDAKDLSIGLMALESGTELEMELIEVVHGLAAVLKKIQNVKEMVLKGE
jgi:hypothetical protein